LLDFTKYIIIHIFDRYYPLHILRIVPRKLGSCNARGNQKHERILKIYALVENHGEKQTGESPQLPQINI
jgi:hypothetical protein